MNDISNESLSGPIHIYILILFIKLMFMKLKLLKQIGCQVHFQLGNSVWHNVLVMQTTLLNLANFVGV